MKSRAVKDFSFFTDKEKEKFIGFLVRHKILSLVVFPIASFLMVSTIPDIISEEPTAYQVIFISVLSLLITVFLLLYQGVAFSFFLYSDKKFNRYLENKKKQVRLVFMFYFLPVVVSVFTYLVLLVLAYRNSTEPSFGSVCICFFEILTLSMLNFLLFVVVQFLTDYLSEPCFIEVIILGYSPCLDLKGP